MQTEGPEQCQEIAAPFGLATTLVLSGRLVQALPYSVCTIKSDLLHLAVAIDVAVPIYSRNSAKVRIEHF
jgi:hypothetical protein